MVNPYETPTPASENVTAQVGGRPLTATVFGVLNILFGIMGLLGSIFGGVMLAVAQSGSIPQIAEQQNLLPVAVQNMNLVNIVVGFFLSIALLVSGIGLLQFRAWGRSISNYYAIISLLMLAVSMTVHVIFIFLPALEIMADAQTPEEIGLVASGFGGLVGGCVGLIYPIAILVFMNRGEFKQRILQAA